MKNTPATRKSSPAKRGIALLLVMIGLVVCSILTAGFLATQGTAIGIARNERDAEHARALAQSGLDMTIWLIKNKSDWRTNMSLANWLDDFPVADGHVIVAAADGDNTGSFFDDPTQPAKLTSVGHYNGRTFTLSATVTPTGGGTIFNEGNFIGTTITLGSGDTSTATIDSYNSSVANYNAALPGSNAAFRSNLANSPALILNGLSVYRGSITVGPNSVLSLATVLSALGIAPVSISAADQPRIPGYAMVPNTATPLTSKGAFSKSSGIYTTTADSSYSSISLTGVTTLNVTNSGILRVTGNLSLGAGSTLNVNNGCDVQLVVDGNITSAGHIKVTGTGKIKIYANANVTVSGSAARINPLQSQPRNVQIFGTANNRSIKINSGAQVTAAIFAPQADVRMEGALPQLYGGLIANSLYIESSGKLHFDEDLRTLNVSTIHGGSAPTGTADYIITTSTSGTLSGSAN